MAGIGFALRELMRRDSLWAIFESQLHGVVAVAGPWFFTIVTMALPALTLDPRDDDGTLGSFITLLLYIFSISLTVSSPISITLTRHVSDQLYGGRTDTAAASFVGALLLGLGALVPFAALGWMLLDLPPHTFAFASLAFALVTVNWIAAPMLTAVAEFRRLTAAYALGAGAFWWLLRGHVHMDIGALLASFDVSMGLTNALICGLILRRFPGRAWPVSGAVRALRRYGVVALGGLLYGAGMWADKWLMWTAPQHTVSAVGLAAYPAYDTVVFIAYVTTVPGLALFIIKAETSLQERCERFYRGIEGHASRDRLLALRSEIVRVFLGAARDVGLVQAAITVLVVALPVVALDLVGGPHAGVFMLRFCAIGAAFQLGSLLMSVVLFYFDSRRSVLLIHGFFALSNLGLTYLGLRLGLRWYGAGYFVACVLTFAVAWVLVHRAFADLLYLGFVRQNPAITEAKVRPAVPTVRFAARTAPGPLRRAHPAPRSP